MSSVLAEPAGERVGAFEDEHLRVSWTTVYERSAGAKPMVTIAIPTFRRPALLAHALRSAALQVGEQSFEILVVDNDPAGDDDAVRQAFAAPELQAIATLRYLRNAENTGMFGNWNRCIALACGRWVTILNDDDLLDPGFMRETLAVVESRPDAALVAVRSRVLDERGDAFGGWRQRLTERWRALRARVNEARIARLSARDYFLNNPHQGSLGILVRRDAAVALGGFSAEAYPSADYYFFAGLQRYYPAYYLNRTLGSYRVLDNESRTAVVAERWVAQGLQLRRALAAELPAPAWLLELYARLLAIHTARYCKAYWKSDLDVPATLSRHGLPNIPVHAAVLLVRVLLARLYFARAT